MIKLVFHFQIKIQMLHENGELKDKIRTTRTKPHPIINKSTMLQNGICLDRSGCILMIKLVFHFQIKIQMLHENGELKEQQQQEQNPTQLLTKSTMLQNGICLDRSGCILMIKLVFHFEIKIQMLHENGELKDKRRTTRTKPHPIINKSTMLQNGICLDRSGCILMIKLVFHFEIKIQMLHENGELKDKRRTPRTKPHPIINKITMLHATGELFTIN